LVYEEITDVSEIVMALQEKIPLSHVPSTPTPIHFCDVPFATFTTHRYSTLPEPGSNIKWWIDVVSFESCWYTVVTLERPLLLPNDSNSQASEMLKQMLCLEQPAASKITAYLQRFKPTVASLIKGNIAPADESSFYPNNPFGTNTLTNFGDIENKDSEELEDEDLDGYLKQLVTKNQMPQIGSMIPDFTEDSLASRFQEKFGHIPEWLQLLTESKKQ